MTTILRSPVQIGSVTYDASPLSDEAKDALDEWVRMKYRQRIAPMIEELSGAAQQAMIREVLNELPTLTFVSHKGAKFMGTVEGMARLLYEMIRPNHKDVKYETLCKDMVDPENIIRAKDKFRELQQLNQLEKAPEEGKVQGS